MSEAKPVHHFSVSNPEGTDPSDVSALLRRLADELEQLGPVLVKDITMGTEVTEEGFMYRITVYFHPTESAAVPA